MTQHSLFSYLLFNNIVESVVFSSLNKEVKTQKIEMLSLHCQQATQVLSIQNMAFSIIHGK